MVVSLPDDLDFFYKSDNARKMLFYFQVSFWRKSELLKLMMQVATLQPEETEEDKVAHENLKKVKASERSVVAMQAKYKVRANINTNASASASAKFKIGWVGSSVIRERFQNKNNKC